MATQDPNVEAIVLQFEAAMAQLRLLSTLPETNRAGPMKKAMNDMQSQISALDIKVKKLINDAQSLRHTTNNRLKAVEAQVQNDKYRQSHKQMDIISSKPMIMRNHKTNEEIAGFPKSFAAFRSLTESNCNRIGDALDWNLEDLPLREKQDFLLALTGFGGKV
ncbi:hypothetical protein BDW02DRAFT_514321, partial [Decorospora gaudefroyi]